MFFMNIVSLFLTTSFIILFSDSIIFSFFKSSIENLSLFNIIEHDFILNEDFMNFNMYSANSFIYNFLFIFIKNAWNISINLSLYSYSSNFFNKFSSSIVIWVNKQFKLLSITNFINKSITPLNANGKKIWWFWN